MKNQRNGFCPVGTDANSPLIYQWVVNQNKTMSRRTAEFQPSLRDWRIFFTNPADKSAGYFQISLRDIMLHQMNGNSFAGIVTKITFFLIPDPQILLF